MNEMNDDKWMKWMMMNKLNEEWMKWNERLWKNRRNDNEQNEWWWIKWMMID